jgi:mannose-6-phosphate isomerase-like protein (cupin superfamily)
VFLAEPFTPRFIFASGIIVAAIALVIGSRARSQPQAASPVLLSDRGSRRMSIETLAASASGASNQPPARPPVRADFTFAHKLSLDAIRRARQASGRAYYEFLREDAMSAGVYFLPAGGVDLQRPHQEDEVYVILEGAGDFRAGEQVRPVGIGDVLYVAAHVPHRFEQIREDLTILVFFAPAETHTVVDRVPETAECC